MTDGEVREIENRWKDLFHECERPVPSGMKRCGYVVDIYNLIKYIRAATAPKCDALVKAAQDVIDHWDTPAWKDVEPTATFINELRQQVAAHRAQEGK